MPDNTSVDRLRRLLQEAKQAVESVSGALVSLEGELAALEQEAEDRAEYYPGPGDQGPDITFTEEEAEIMPLKMLLTVQEAAFLLGIQSADVYRLIREGKLPVFKLGRTVRIPTKRLQDYIDQGRSSPAEEEITAPEKERPNEQRTRPARASRRDRKAGRKTADTRDETAAINAKQLLTVREAASVLKLHTTAVYGLIYKGELPSCRLGRSIRISRKELEGYIKSARAGEGEGELLGAVADPGGLPAE